MTATATSGWNAAPANMAGRFRTTPRRSMQAEMRRAAAGAAASTGWCVTVGSVRLTDPRRHDRQRVPGVTVPPGVHLVAQARPNRQLGRSRSPGPSSPRAKPPPRYIARRERGRAGFAPLEPTAVVQLRAVGPHGHRGRVGRVPDDETSGAGRRHARRVPEEQQVRRAVVV